MYLNNKFKIWSTYPAILAAFKPYRNHENAEGEAFVECRGRFALESAHYPDGDAWRPAQANIMVVLLASLALLVLLRLPGARFLAPPDSEMWKLERWNLRGCRSGVSS